MHRLAITFFAALLAAHPVSIFAQAPEDPPVDAEPAEETKAPEEEPVAAEMPGDVLVLESGRRMTGVQVVRATPQFYEVELLDGLKIEIPRRRVKEVIYDDVDPSRDRLKQELFPEQQEVTIASGERVTSALRDALMAPVSDVPLSYTNQDFADVLEEIKTAKNLNLRVHPSIRELPQPQRRWTIEVPAGKSLLSLLREDLVGTFDFVEVIFESDRIIVLTKDAASKRAAGATKKPEGAAPPGGEAPPEGEAPPASEPPKSE